MKKLILPILAAITAFVSLSACADRDDHRGYGYHHDHDHDRDRGPDATIVVHSN